MHSMEAFLPVLNLSDLSDDVSRAKCRVEVHDRYAAKCLDQDSTGSIGTAVSGQYNCSGLFVILRERVGWLSQCSESSAVVLLHNSQAACTP